MRFIGRVAATLAIAAGTVSLSLSAHAQATLAAAKKRGHVLCGVNGQLPGFAFPDSTGRWSGFEVDFCRAVAAAALGDATKVQFVPVTTADRFDLLRQGKLDVLTRNTIDTMERTVGTGVRTAAVLYLDRQVVAVSRDLKAEKLVDLNQGSVCTLRNTPYETALHDWFGARNLTVKTVTYPTQDTLYKALYDGTCGAVTQVMTPLASTIVASGKQANYIVLPDLVALQPLAAFVRNNDEAWLDVVRWTFNALLHGEDLKITRASAASERSSSSPEVRRLLGVEPGYGKRLGLDEAWAFNILSQVGNYGEIYERNIGMQSPLRFGRGVNALWDNGGILYAPPLR